MLWAVLPLKDLLKAKSRLSGVLAPHERRALAQAMVEDVLTALTGAAEISGITLVSDDPVAELLAHKYPLTLLPESGLGARGLNGVLTESVKRLAGEGIFELMIIHADLPLVQSQDVTALYRAWRAPATDVVIAPDIAATGTNVMVFDSRRRPRFHYGAGSCQLHRQSALRLDLRYRLLQLPGLGLDVDNPGDLLHLYHELQAGRRGDHVADILLGAGIAQRLSLIERSGLDPLQELEKYDAM